MPTATFRHGAPVMVDYTPTGGNIAAGDVVLLGNTTGLTNGVAHRDIENSKLGALGVGGGVYSVKVAGNYAPWSKLYWDAANSVLTTTSTNMSLFGYNVEASPAANSVIKVLHRPNG